MQTNPHHLMFRRFFFLLCLLQLLLAPCVQAGERGGAILPRDWRPDLSSASEWLERVLKETEAQQGMNQLSRCLADLKDAELLTIYVRLYQTLTPPEQQSLLQEQTKWLSKRRKAAEDGIESGGGSLAPTEANMAEMKFTQMRIAELTKRLSGTPLKQP
jgi:uncharacterized protein YecT (DUF1311 family)